VLRQALAPVASWGVNRFTDDAILGTDNLDFLLEGIPNLLANQEEANYVANYHASSDTFDKVAICHSIGAEAFPLRRRYPAQKDRT
jgi:hypothetical protein